ncbi:MAG: peptidoglycan-binding protein [Candidatus Omnitrophica bacterium]|nr:peptidoglycan-binding protein [Candidatus Omnitrophota bacterium]
MFKSFALLAGVLMFLTGCATTQSGQSAADLQLRVSDLENQVAAKDAEIKDLKYTMKDMAYDLDRNKTQRSSTSKTDVYTKNDDILRVNVSAEKVQKALKAAGYYKGNVDGKLGTGSKAAISKFQKDHGLKVDGIVGEQTWRELKNAAGQ